MVNNKLPISAIVRTYNEEQNIEECIRFIFKNNPSEIIVVDGGSTDGTVNIAKSMGVKVIKSKKGLVSQRQAGTDVSSQKYIALIDADDRLDKNCLYSLLDELKENRFDAIKALNYPYKPKTYWEKGMASTLLVEGALPRETTMVGRPALYLASSIKKVKPDLFFNGSHEDTDLSRTFENMGFKQGLGTGKTYRKQKENFKDYLKIWSKYGRGDAHFVYKYPERRWSIIKHLLINYPIVKPYKAIVNRNVKYIPFFILMGLARFINFLHKYILLNFKYIGGKLYEHSFVKSLWKGFGHN